MDIKRRCWSSYNEKFTKPQQVKAKLIMGNLAMTFFKVFPWFCFLVVSKNQERKAGNRGTEGETSVGQSCLKQSILKLLSAFFLLEALNAGELVSRQVFA